MKLICTKSPTIALLVNHLPVRWTSFMLRAFVFLCMLGIAAQTTLAQNIQFTQGSVGSGLENSLQIPLRAYPGRGAASLPITLYYSSKVWRIGQLNTVNNGSHYQTITEAIYAEHSNAGWKTSLDIPKIEWPKSLDGYFYSGGPYNFAGYSGANAYRVRRVYIHMPDGSTHELRENDQPYQGAIDMQGTFYAVDGSRMRYESTGENTGTLYLPDGARYILNGGTAQYIDRNGNTLNYNASTRQWTDTLGRAINVPFPANPQPQYYTYTLPGIGGTNLPYTFRWQRLSEDEVLTPGANGQTPARKAIASHYLPHPSQTPSPQGQGNYPVSSQSANLFHSDAPADASVLTMVVGRGQDGGNLFDPVVLTEIIYPNGLKYRFTYNIYGEIDKIVYPTGGFERYEYNQVDPVGDVKPPYTQANRAVTKRQLSANGTGTDIAEWQYAVSTVYGDASVPAGTLLTSTTAPDGTLTKVYRKSLYAPGHGNSQTPYWAFGYEDPLNGVVFDERVHAPATQGGAMLRRKLTDWERTTNAVPPRLGIPGEATETAYRNVRPKKEVSIILDTGGQALAKTVTYSYDTAHQLTFGLDLTTSTESNFASINQTTAQEVVSDTILSLPAGLPASTAVTTYLNDAAYRERNILGLATSVVLKDANGQVVSKTETFYDEANYLVNVTGQATGWTDPGPTVRGNATTSRRYVTLSPETYLETHVSYDQWGNVRSTWDARGKQSQVDYLDSFGDEVNRNTFAYPTLTTTAIPDPTGVHGSNTAFTSSSVYDYSTGLILSSKDANLQTTTFSYRDEQNTPDPLNRLRKVTRPDGGWTRYSFNDAIGNFYTQTETQVDGARVTTARQYFDALGRSVRSFAFENTDPNAQWLGSDTYYDLMGRVSKVSNAYRTGTPSAIVPSVCALCTSSVYDALGRVTTVTLTDGTSVQTTYQGVYTTVTDQAGKQRRQKTDALGRIVRLDEPDASGYLGNLDAPVQPTLYIYNTQGSVIRVAQGITQPGLNPDEPNNYLQHRYFKYDALSRLTYERQIEQVATFTAADSLTGNSQWTRKVVYDEGVYQGLPTTMIDARNVSTQYQYDNLNRIYQVSYSDGTPTLTNKYDQARTGYLNKGRLTEIQTAAIAAQGVMPAIPQTSQVYDFDLMGRVKRQQQVVGTQTYTLSYAYNVGGQLISQTYPSGRVVNYDYDDAARLNGVRSGATIYASNFQYGPKGVLASLNLGNGSSQTFAYNDRLQLTTLSLVKDSNTLQRYEYKYGKVNADGTVDETKNNGQIGRIEGYIGTQKQWQQRFSYDSLGRLSSASEHRGDNSLQSYLINYTYDSFGNRSQPLSSNTNSLPYTPVEDSHISKTTNRFNSGVTYDNAGNVTVDNKFRGRQYQYDANGRQRWTALLDGTGAAASVYDAAGQRVATISNGAMSVMVYDAGGKLVAEYGQPAATGGTQYVFTDHQGSTRVVTNQSGVPISRQDYQPFGEEIGEVGMRSTDPYYGDDNSARQKYAGMEQDDGSGMSHTLWRKYDSQSGRWTSPDPYGGSMSISDPQSFNRYSYVNNDPVNLVDPLGLMGASAGWGSVANGFWGDDVMSERAWGGRDDTAHAEARHDSGVKEAMALKAFRKAWDKEDYDGARRILDASPGVGYEMTSVTVSAEVTGVAGELQQTGQSTQSPEWTCGPLIVSREDIREFDGANCVDQTCDCVPLVKGLTGTMNVSAKYRWREGEKVLGNPSIEYGTAIATFFNGRYPSWETGNHAAIFLRQVPPSKEYPLGGIEVLDQTKRRGHVGRRVILNREGRGSASDDASRFSVILYTAPPRGRR